MKFHYKALGAGGKAETGTLEASTKKAAMQALMAKGLKPLSLRSSASDSASAASTQKPANTKQAAPKQQAEVKASDIRGSKRQLALGFLKKVLQLQSGGMALGDTIKLLGQRLTDPGPRYIAQTLWRELSQGRPLAVAMAQMPDFFDSSIRHLVEAGEATGNMRPILENIIAHLEEKEAIRKKLVQGLTYPAFICTMVMGVIFFFLFFLLPRIEGMVNSLGGKMNLATRILIAGSQVMLKGGPFFLAGLFVLAVFLVRMYQKPKGRMALDDILLRLPLIGKIINYSQLYQSSNLIATLMSSGINTSEALRLSEKTIQNAVLQTRFRNARVQINEGAAFSVAFRSQAFMPDLALDILSVGENTGSIQDSLFEANRIFREELNHALKIMTTGIASGALAFAFILVGLTAVGMILSIFQVSQNIKMRG